MDAELDRIMEGPKKLAPIGRRKSYPGKAEQMAWKRVLRELVVTPATNRAQRLRGLCD
jgi:hypothetical protein